MAVHLNVLFRMISFLLLLGCRRCYFDWGGENGVRGKGWSVRGVRNGEEGWSLLLSDLIIIVNYNRIRNLSER